VTGLDGRRVYLDWNATAPLRPEARAAMLEAMDVVGNPSSVHAEGRAAKAIVEKARGQVAALMGCEPSEVVFTSGATEAAAAVLNWWSGGQTVSADIEHDCVSTYRRLDLTLRISPAGIVELNDAFYTDVVPELGHDDRIAIQSANPETGTTQPLSDLAPEIAYALRVAKKAGNAGAVRIFSDVVQSVGKTDLSLPDGVDLAAASAHKIGGPKGIGILVARCDDLERNPFLDGGGQEQGRRSGTENVIGIAGFGAAAEAARRDLEDGVWDRVARLRDDLEDRLASHARDLIAFGKQVPRLPNTSCFAVPGWRGETQVMQMDLAGFAVSAGSACASGKVNKASRVLLAMGFDEVIASSAIRVSMGATTTEAEVMAFADAWIEQYRRRRERAA
jgi:cysteine desulfurase